MIGQLSVRGRLTSGFTILMVLALLQGGASLYYLAALNERVNQIYAREVVAITDSARAKSHLYGIRQAAAEIRTGKEAQERADGIAEQREWLAGWAQRYAAAAEGAVEHKLADSFAHHFDGFAGAVERAVQDRAPLSEDGQHAFAKADALLNDIVSFNDHSARTRQQYAIADHAMASQIVVVLAATIFVLSCVIAVVITRSVTRPLRAVVEAADRVAAGDLSVRVTATSSDELGRVLQAMQNMTEQLASLVFKVRDCSRSVGTAATRLAQASTDLADRTEEQASSLEETASSVEQVTATVRQNAEHASQTHGFVVSTRESAANGAAAMGVLASNMEAAYAAAQKIAAISHVISEIAHQTNILSLNAAVEAARAGASGQGFAVVAGEVRNLASRSAAAARDVQALIDDSLQKASTGKELVGRASGRMQEIAVHVQKASELLQEMALASKEQSDGIAQVNDAMIQIDQITQGNLASAGETAAAARSLEENAALLTAAVALFKLEKTPPGQSGAAVEPARQITQRPALSWQAA